MSVAFPSGAGAWIGVTNAHGDSATMQEDVYRASCQTYLVTDYFHVRLRKEKTSLSFSGK